jgi:hypothetical protein
VIRETKVKTTRSRTVAANQYLCICKADRYQKVKIVRGERQGRLGDGEKVLRTGMQYEASSAGSSQKAGFWWMGR